jgi:hypothetical protein
MKITDKVYQQVKSNENFTFVGLKQVPDHNLLEQV